MKTYEDKLLAAAHELYEKKVFWSQKPKRVAGVLLWLSRRFGWKIPTLYHMRFWHIVVFFGAVLVPTKLLFDFFLFQERSFMMTTGYWYGFALILLMTTTWFAGFFRFIAWRKGLSRWEDL